MGLRRGGWLSATALVLLWTGCVPDRPRGPDGAAPLDYVPPVDGHSV